MGRPRIICDFWEVVYDTHGSVILKAVFRIRMRSSVIVNLWAAEMAINRSWGTINCLEAYGILTSICWIDCDFGYL